MQKPAIHSGAVKKTAFILAGLIIVPSLLVAQTWNGGGFTDDWSDASNWTALPVSGPSTVLNFAGTTRLTPFNNLGNPFEMDALMFDPSAGSFNLTGDPLYIYGTLAMDANADITISSDLLIGNLTIDGSGTGMLTLAGALKNTGSALLLDRPGVTVFANSGSDYQDGTTIMQGTARLGVDNGLPAGYGLSMMGGAFDMNGFNQTLSNLGFGDGVTVLNPALVTGGGTLTLGQISYTSDFNNLSAGAKIESSVSTNGGGILLQGNFSGSSNYDVVVTGQVSGGGDMILQGLQTRFAFTQPLAHTGNLTVDSGTLYLATANAIPSSALVTVNGGNLSFAPAVTTQGVTAGDYDQTIAALTGNGGTVQIGNSTLTFSSDNLLIDYNGDLVAGPAGKVIKKGTTSQFLSGNNTISTGFDIQDGMLGFKTIASMGTGGANVLVGSGAAAGAGNGGGSYPMDQTFLDRLDPASTGVAAVVDASAGALDFTGLPNVRLGAGLTGSVFTGSINPAAGTYMLGGGAEGGILIINAANVLTSTNAVDIGGNGVTGTAVYYGAAQDYTGGTKVGADTTLSFLGAYQLPLTGEVTMDGGTLALNATAQQIGKLSGNTGTVEFGVGGILAIGADNNDATYNGAFSGIGTLLKIGGGKQELGSAFTTIGPVVSSGTLEITGSYIPAQAPFVGGGTLKLTGGGVYGSGLSLNTQTGGTIEFAGGIHDLYLTQFASTDASPVVLSSGNLRMNNFGQNYNTGATFTINGGTLTMNNPGSLAGANVWTGGAIEGAAVLSVSGNLTIQGSGTKTLNGNIVKSGSPTFWNDGTIDASGGGTFTSNITIQGDDLFTGGTLTGGLFKQTATGVTEIAANYNLPGGGFTGFAGGNTGTIRFTGGGTIANGAVISTNTDGKVEFSGGTYTFNGNSQVMGSAGTSAFTINGATVDWNSTGSIVSQNVNLTSGTLGGSGNFVVNGPAFWEGTTLSGSGVMTFGSNLTIQGAGTKLLNKAVIKTGVSALWSDGTIDASGGGSFTGNISIMGDDLFTGGTLTGSLIKNGGTGVTEIAANYNLPGGFFAGFTTANPGTIRFTGGGTMANGSTISTNSDGKVEFSGGTYTFNGNSQLLGSAGTSAFTINGATVDWNSTGSIISQNVNLTSGTLGGSGNFVVNGPAFWEGTTLSGSGVMTFGSNLTIQGAGTKLLNKAVIKTGVSAVWNDGTIDASGGGSFTGNIAIQGDDLFTGGTLTGSLIKQAGTGVTEIAANYILPGGFFMGFAGANPGTLRFTGGGTMANGSTIGTSSDGKVELSGGTYTFNGNSQVQGAAGTSAFTVNGATVDWNSTGAIVSQNVNLTSGTFGGAGSPAVNGPAFWDGATLSGSGAMTFNSSLTIQGALTKTLNKALTKTSGNALWSGGNINATGGGSFTGGLTVEGNNSFLGGTLSGSIVKQLSSGVSTFTGTVNTGISDSIIVGSGTIALLGGGVLDGTTTVNNGTTLQVDGFYTGSGLISVAGGTLKGSGGTLSGPVSVLAGGTIAPGASPGILTILDDVTMADNSILDIELNGLNVGTEYDLFSLTGLLTLNTPTLDITLGFAPSEGSTFTILSYGSLTGTFDGLPDGTDFTVGGTIFDISYGANSTILTVVPEPFSSGLLMIGGVAILGIRRRRL